MKNLLAVICLTVLLISTVSSQSAAPFTTGNSKINQLCPEFSFDTLFNYKKEKLALSELKGKFVIVDFWGTFCLPCIAAFPKLENWQKRFGDSLQILLVATDGYQKTKQFYETRKNANKPMYLPCAINRSMARYFQVREVSTYVWIDDKGYIRAVTDESQLTEKNIVDFINRNEIVVREKEKMVDIGNKRQLVEVAKEIDSNSVVFGSVLTRYLKGVTPVISVSRNGINRNRIYAHNMGIRNLYQVAYGDSIRPVQLARTVIECAQPEKLALPKNADYETWRVDNTYCYEINVPEAKHDSIRKMMRDDLQQLFGYNAYQEYRTQKCLILKAEKGFRYLEDTTVASKMTISAGGVTVTNYPFQRFSGLIGHYHQDKIFLDETGLTGAVDITIQAIMNDVDELNRHLKKYGLSLHYEDRQVLMLVIKDPR